MAKVPVIRSSDNRNGIIAAVLYFLLTLFLLFFITYSEPDPPKVTVPIPITLGEAGIDNFEVESGGGGTPSETVDPTPAISEENPPEQFTQEEESPIKVSEGVGETQNTQTNTQVPQQHNPFSGSGTGGHGTKGTGSGFGSDDGPGIGDGAPGTGAGGDRIRLLNIQSKPKTHNDEVSIIALKLTIDADGRVFRADFIRNQSTTTNQALIEEVIDLAKKEVKYKAKPGAKNEVVFYTIEVKPN